MKETINAKELYFSKVLLLKDDMRIRKYRFTLEDENKKLYQKIQDLKRQRVTLGVKIVKLANKERELLGFEKI